MYFTFLHTLIKVLIYTADKGSDTVVGCQALDVTDTDEPTMKLGLKRGDQIYNQHIVIHEFGHALGLQHEHQRSCFLTTAKKYLDEHKIKKSQNISEKIFRRDWWDSLEEIDSESSYDEDSVMHYW